MRRITVLTALTFALSGASAQAGGWADTDDGKYPIYTYYGVGWEANDVEMYAADGLPEGYEAFADDPEGALFVDKGAEPRPVFRHFLAVNAIAWTLRLQLGNNDDRAHVGLGPLVHFVGVIDGGPGNDQLTVNTNAHVIGGDGHDWIRGGLGRQTVDCGPGYDIVVAGENTVTDESCEVVQ